LTNLLCCGAYRREDVAALFGLEVFEVEVQFGPGRYIRTADILAKVANAGNYDSVSATLPTDASASAFQAATAAYGLQSILGSKPTWDNAAIAALFGISIAVPNSVFLSPPTLSAAVLQTCLAVPGSFPYGNVTSATVAAAQAA